MLRYKSLQSLLFLALLSGLSLEAQAGASLPQEQLNLTLLDLNGSPFRYFHLSSYHEGVLNYRRIPQGLNALKPITDIAKVKLEQMHYITGLALPKVTYKLVQQEIVEIASHVDENLMRYYFSR